MLVAAGMTVLMLMSKAFLVKMNMAMGLITYCPVQAPDKVGKTKNKQQPCRKIPPQRLNRFQFKYRYAKTDSDKTKDNRTKHMAKPAGYGYGGSLGQDQLSGMGHGNKGKA